MQVIDLASFERDANADNWEIRKQVAEAVCSIPLSRTRDLAAQLLMDGGDSAVVMAAFESLLKSQDPENLKLACEGYAITDDSIGDDLNTVLISIRAANGLGSLQLDLEELFSSVYRSRYSPLASEGAMRALEWLGADTSTLRPR